MMETHELVHARTSYLQCEYVTVQTDSLLCRNPSPQCAVTNRKEIKTTTEFTTLVKIADVLTCICLCWCECTGMYIPIRYTYLSISFTILDSVSLALILAPFPLSLPLIRFLSVPPSLLLTLPLTLSLPFSLLSLSLSLSLVLSLLHLNKIMHILLYGYNYVCADKCARASMHVYTHGCTVTCLCARAQGTYPRVKHKIVRALHRFVRS